uniref:Uncharacterized protein n=1 Tax=Peronospora matthiolae TaxID=2874970 RepID=A0AAV1TTE5_9STRA
MVRSSPFGGCDGLNQRDTAATATARVTCASVDPQRRHEANQAERSGRAEVPIIKMTPFRWKPR